MDATSADLLERYRTGDPLAADALFTRYVERLTEMARWRISPQLRRRIDPEDAVHSAYRSFFVRAGRGDFKLEHSGDLWKLLVTMTLHKLRRQIAHHRAVKRSVGRDVCIDAGISLCADGPSPLEALAAEDELISFMAMLTPDARTILQMRLQDRTWPEIALATGRPERTVRRVIESVRDRWRAQSSSETLVFEDSEHSSPAPPQTPALLAYDEFLLKELIGSGGSGKVYRARWQSENREVAVKVLRKPRWTSPEAVDRFLNEAAVVARMSHPGIIRTHGVGRTGGGGLFLVMELIDGPSLEAVLADRIPDPRQAAEWIARTAEAVAYAHSQGVVHCDLKPGNMLLPKDGRIKVGDFGLATGGENRGWAGTPGYMAPEQLDPAFGEVSPATDVFALGLVLMRLLTGQMVFDGKRLLDTLAGPAADWVDTFLEESIPAPLHGPLKACLHLDPMKRTRELGVWANSLRSVFADS